MKVLTVSFLGRPQGQNPMAHRLKPPDGQPHLSPAEIARRLDEEFFFCDVDREQGQDDVGDMLAKLIQLNAPPSLIDEIASGRKDSLRITISDEEWSDDGLSFFVRPGDGFLIGYHSAHHEEATNPLLLRCAQALGYMVTLV